MGTTGTAALLNALLGSPGDQRQLKGVVWQFVTSGSLKLAGLPQRLANSWDAFLAYTSEAASSGMCTDGVHASVVLVGHEGAGKTTLVARLANGVFRDDTTPTIGLCTCTLLCVVIRRAACSRVRHGKCLGGCHVWSQQRRCGQLRLA